MLPAVFNPMMAHQFPPRAAGCCLIEKKKISKHYVGIDMVCTIIATTRLLTVSSDPPGAMPSRASHARAPPNHPPPLQLCPPPPPNPPHGRGAGYGKIADGKKVPHLKKSMAPPTPKPRDATPGAATTRCNPILPPQKELDSVAIYLRHRFLWTHARF